MVFKWRLSRPAFQATVAGVEVMHAGIETEFETGSPEEAAGIFTDSGTALAALFGTTLMGNASGLALSVDNEAQGEQTATRKPRKPRGSAADPATATAPEPIAIPGVEAPPIAPPPAPPAPPAAPPTGVLAGKISAELEKRATGSADGGQALADWLATSGITVKGATFAEAVTVLRLQADEKLGPIAAALGVQ